MPPLSYWFWGFMALALIGCFLAGWGSAPPRAWGWGWGVPLFFILILILILGIAEFGSQVKG